MKLCPMCHDCLCEGHVAERTVACSDRVIKKEYNMVLDSLKAEAFDRLCIAAADPSADLRKLILESERDMDIQIEQRKADERA